MSQTEILKYLKEKRDVTIAELMKDLCLAQISANRQVRKLHKYGLISITIKKHNKIFINLR